MGTGLHYYYIAIRADDVKDPGMMYNPRGEKYDWMVMANHDLYLRINLRGSTFSYTTQRLEATPFKTRAEAEKMAFDITALNLDLVQKLRVTLS